MQNFDIKLNYEAIADEIKVWLPILSEHLKFHRGGLDPSPKQDCIFQNLDYSARQLDQLFSFVFSLEDSAAPPYNNQTQLIYPYVIATKDIKQFMYKGIKECEILSIIPSGLADHMIRETLRFLGIISNIKPTRHELGIPGDDKRVIGAPRMLINTLPAAEKFTALLEEIMFFSRINAEHAHYIAATTKPEIQSKIARKAKEFEGQFRENLEKAVSVEKRKKGMDSLIEDSLKLMDRFRSFMLQLIKDAQSCSLPGEQMNHWPLLDNHLLREIDYFIELLKMAK
jgi:hypothetical protein